MSDSSLIPINGSPISLVADFDEDLYELTFCEEYGRRITVRLARSYFNSLCAELSHIDRQFGQHSMVIRTINDHVDFALLGYEHLNGQSILSYHCPEAF